MTFTKSLLINYIKLSPNRTPRTHIIDTITIHCMAGNLSVESCGNIFASKSRQASSNYGIGSDGRIALYVDEKDRSWCTSNAANDNRAVTIEVANDGGAPDWHVSDKAMNSLINLVVDICKRNNIKELKWRADKTLIGQVDKQNMTVHRWFAAKACPGEYLYKNHSYIAAEVNKKLGIVSPPASNSTTSELYRVRKSWNDVSSQIGAYSSLNRAKNACKAGYSVFDSNGNKIYSINSNNSNTPTQQSSKKNINVDVRYRVYAAGKWYPEVKNLTDYAGDGRNPIRGISIKVSSGSVKYRVHCKNKGWYPYVSGYNVNDYNNGFAGDKKNNIDAVEVSFTTPHGYVSKHAKYRIAPVGGNYYSWQSDNQKTSGQDGYAGSLGKSFGKFQICIE